MISDFRLCKLKLIMREAIKRRSKEVSLAIINMTEKFPGKMAAVHVAKQIIRSSTSVAANYRAVCRARSNKEFIAKLEIAIEEADETLFWLEIIKDKKWFVESQIDKIFGEMNELLSIFISSAKTVKNKMKMANSNHNQ